MEVVRDVLAILGGAGIIILVLLKILGSIWRDRITQKQIQKFGVRRIQADKFAESQFDVYIELWQSLQGLKFCVDATWEKATLENVKALKAELSITNRQINRWSLFINKKHLKALKNIIKTISDFEAGKTSLIQLNSLKLIDSWGKHLLYQIEKQVHENQELKQSFEILLEEIRREFQKSLTSLDNVTI